MPISNISDTARWVAMYRAIESQRPDALFRDPWAERLAGERGREILDAMPGGRAMAWPMLVRTAVMDEIIVREVREGRAATVLNLAAGLDMRPYRLPLPAVLRWIEVDLPGMVAEKDALVGSERPACRLERRAVDLISRPARRAFFAELEGAGPVLVVSEGLLIYLDPAEVLELARDLAAVPTIRRWLIDIISPPLLKMVSRRWGKAVEQGGAPFKFAPAEGTRYFEPAGWREVEFRSTFEEAGRLHREPPFAWLWRIMIRLSPARRREEVRRMGGIALLERVG